MTSRRGRSRSTLIRTGRWLGGVTSMRLGNMSRPAPTRTAQRPGIPIRTAQRPGMPMMRFTMGSRPILDCVGRLPGPSMMMDFGGRNSPILVWMPGLPGGGPAKGFRAGILITHPGIPTDAGGPANHAARGAGYICPYICQGVGSAYTCPGRPGTRYTWPGTGTATPTLWPEPATALPHGFASARPAFLNGTAADGADRAGSSRSVTSAPASAAAAIQPTVRLVASAPALRALILPMRKRRRARNGTVSGCPPWSPAAGSDPGDCSSRSTNAPYLVALACFLRIAARSKNAPPNSR
jgi:hypothetical protein